MSKRTVGYIDPNHITINSIGNMIIPQKESKHLHFVKNVNQLLFQYSNLIRKLGKEYSRNFRTYDEDEDLFAYIKEAFVELAIEYDPYSGVDFAGYIARKLPLRIKYSYISKKFLQRSRTVLLTSGDYSINDLIDLIQDHGEGQITMDKKHRVSKIRHVHGIDFSFKERIDDILDKVPMGVLDRTIFIFLIDGFNKYKVLTRLVKWFERKHHLKKHSVKVIKNRIKRLKKELRNYYLQRSSYFIKEN